MTPDLVVLDVAMPGLDGLAVCRRVRSRGLGLPILLLTARDALEDRVRASTRAPTTTSSSRSPPEELLARVRALLRRGSEPAEVLAHEDLVLDVRARSAQRGGRDLELSPRETDLLELLLRNRRRLVTREQALAEVWGDQFGATHNAVDRYVSYLRRKLGEPELIRTVRGSGYILG